jgi:mono/diheme cytochrome c family protein
MAHKSSWRKQRLVLIGLTICIIGAACNAPDVPKSNGVALTDEEVKKTYNVKCGICHGEDGSMQYAGAKDLSKSTLAKDEVIQQIKFGKGTMPPMKNVLDDQAIEQLADFAMRLRKP